MSDSRDFKVLGPLNAGTGSRALLALQIRHEPPRPVVLLPIPAEVLDDAELTLRLRRETERALSLEHPSILRVHGLVDTQQGLARAVEYANGETLRTVLDRTKRLPAGFAAKLVAEVSAGVHYAHLAGNEDGSPLVHGDLRPETLMVSFDGSVKVSGYGALSVAPREPGGKRVPGRRMYAAPEQLLGGRVAMSTQTDVFLLGLVLWEVLTGLIPFQDSADPDQAILGEELIVELPHIPEKLGRVIARATSKKGKDRYPSALALHDAIEEAAGPLPSNDELGVWLEKEFDGDPAREEVRQRIARGVEELKAPASPRPPPPPKDAADVASPVGKAAAQPPSAPEEQPVGQAAVQSASSAQLAVPPAAPAKAVPTARPTSSPLRAIPLALLGAVLIAAVSYWGLRTVQLAPVPDSPAADQPTELAADQQHAPLEVAFVQPAAPQARPAYAAAQKPSSEAKVEPNRPPPAIASDETVEKLGVPALEDLTLPSIDLSSVPALDVAVDGKSLGRTPLKKVMQPGRHTLTLTNKEMGIRATREVEINALGLTRVEIWLGTGTIGINAPAEASVYVDGKLSGKTPLEQRIEVYEGTHDLLVDMGEAEWKRQFTIQEGEKLNFEVTVERRPRAIAGE